MVMIRRSWIPILFCLCLACGGGGSEEDHIQVDSDDPNARLGLKYLEEESNADDDYEGPGMWWFPEDDSELFVITSPWPPTPNQPVQMIVETGMGDWEVKLIQDVQFQLSSDGVADGEWISMTRTELDEYEDRFDATVTWPDGLTCVHVRLHKGHGDTPEDLPMWVIEG
jgi:hypothetical protein